MGPTLTITPDPSGSSSSSYALNLPPRLLVLPPAALGLGLVIGMSRGGSRARLRFLAENAHRMPTTIQGWYFYTKTRNYRILFSAARQGARDGLLLGAATAGYVLLEEGTGRLRATIQQQEPGGARWKGKGREGGEAGSVGAGRVDWEGPAGAAPDGIQRTDRIGESKRTPGANGWEWFDGGVAGGAMGLVVGLLYRFPGAMILRTATLGLILGGSEGGLRIVQSKVGALKAEEDARHAVAQAEEAERARLLEAVTDESSGVDVHEEQIRRGTAHDGREEHKIPLFAMSTGKNAGNLPTSERI